MRKVKFYLVTVLVSMAILVIAMELMATLFLYIKDGRFISVKHRFDSLGNNTFLQDVTREGASCRYVDTLFPHPYLGFVHHANPPCGLSYINNIGLFGPDFPVEKISDRFVLLVTGGSVAAQLVQINPEWPRYFEEELNERYTSPGGQPFLVLNGADGAWKQPQQLIIFLLYADVVDAVITLDGFNEHENFGSTRRLEYPANNFLVLNPLAGYDYTQVVQLWGLGKVYGLIVNNAVLSRSQAAYVVVAGLAKIIRRPVAIGEWPTTVESIFALPSEWSRDKRVNWAIEQYRKYIKAMDAVASDRGVLIAHFIQPVPAIGKQLTAEERRIVGDLSYRDIYRQMTDRLLQLNGEATKIYSLLDVFKDVDDTLYADHVHLRRTASGESVGYRLMAQEMAELLAQTWSLERRP